MRLPPTHLALAIAVTAVVVIGGVLYPMWRQAVDTNLDARADPHHIAGNLYFVGSPDVTAFLIVGPDGHILISSGEELTARKVIDNIEQLGFDIKDVRILLGSGGALTALKQASGAELWTSDVTADVLASGGASDPGVVYTPYRLMKWAGITTYPPVRVDHRVRDGETIRLGPLAVTAHVTPGTAFNCTTWTFTVRDGDRDLRVVHRCNLTLPYGASLADPERPAGIRGAYERTLAIVRSLPVDIWLTAQGREYGRYRKYQDSLTRDDPAVAFIDPQGYVAAIDAADTAFRKMLDEQRR
jgi:metallo-beta-lactamase class B